MGGKAIVVFVVLKIREKYVLYVYRSIGVWGSGLGLFIGNRRLSRKFPIKRERRKLGNPCVCVCGRTNKKRKRGEEMANEEESNVQFSAYFSSSLSFPPSAFLAFLFPEKRGGRKNQSEEREERRRRKLLEKIWRGGKNGEEGRKKGGEKMLSENIKKWYKSFSFFCFCLFLPFVASYTAGLFRDEGAYSLAWRTLDEWSS